MVKTQKLQVGRNQSRVDCMVLDVAFLDANTFGDKILRAEIISLFLAQLEAVQARMQMPLDEKSWAYLTHTLKGAAAAVGAQQLASMADDWGHCPHPATLSARHGLEADVKRSIMDFKTVATTLAT